MMPVKEGTAVPGDCQRTVRGGNAICTGNPGSTLTTPCFRKQKTFSLCSFILVLEPHSMMFKGYFWLCDQELPLAVLDRPDRVLEIELG